MTTHPVLDLLPCRRASGPWQMAADEWMLERAVEGVSSLRFYSWDPATVSLGYFQKHAERTANPKLAAYPWVRRCTGGGAIIHDQDLTYAFALSEEARGNLAPLAWHNRFHEALAKVLQCRRISALVLAGARKPQEDLDYLCFTVPQPGDVVLDGQKIIGGAQRLRRGGLLQHGSMQLPNLADDAELLAEQLAAALGWRLQRRDWTQNALEVIDRLVETKYGRDAWNKKR